MKVLIKKGSIRFLHVVGGGCFGTQYTRWLIRAKILKLIDFEKILVVDRNPQCQIKKENLDPLAWELVESDWIDYFSKYLQENYLSQEASLDHWVPSPLSPHILFLGMLRAAQTLHPHIQLQQSSFNEVVPPPVRMPLKNGNLAVSFAQWKCPVNCLEPPQCPAIQDERNWDMKKSLDDYFKPSQKTRSAHVLQCHPLALSVGTISCQAIFEEFKNLLSHLEDPGLEKITVATVSGCHGLIGQARVSV